MTCCSTIKKVALGTVLAAGGLGTWSSGPRPELRPDGLPQGALQRRA